MCQDHCSHDDDDNDDGGNCDLEEVHGQFGQECQDYCRNDGDDGRDNFGDTLAEVGGILAGHVMMLIITMILSQRYAENLLGAP